VGAAQTAGAVPIDVEADAIDLLAFTGHKGLHGPPGTGGLVLGPQFDAGQLAPLMHGGTGSRSESQHQPDVLPDKFESGTPNGAGIAGLGAGVRWVMAYRGRAATIRHAEGEKGRRGEGETTAFVQTTCAKTLRGSRGFVTLAAQGVEALRAKELMLAGVLREGLREIPGVTVYGPREADRSVAVVSFTAAGKDVSTLGEQLDERFGVLCRVGLHCAPAAHQTIGTFPSGTVRLAPGPMATQEEMHRALEAIRKVVASA
jgi:selenocysteine lyase/cysteine desulfurase